METGKVSPSAISLKTLKSARLFLLPHVDVDTASTVVWQQYLPTLPIHFPSPRPSEQKKFFLQWFTSAVVARLMLRGLPIRQYPQPDTGLMSR